MKNTILSTFSFLVFSSAFADCELLSVADAESVLGPDITDVSGDDADFQCFFVGGEPQGTFIVQFATRAYYDQVSILQPHTPADVGEEGRSNIDTNGVTALQFFQGDRSVTMSVRTVSASDRDYLAALVTVGRILAERL